MKNFRTYNQAVTFYKLARVLPVKGHVKDQLHRAAYSIPLNLAEGRDRSTAKDKKRFFTIALGSTRECQAILSLEDFENTEAWRALDSVAAHIYRLIQKT